MTLLQDLIDLLHIFVEILSRHQRVAVMPWQDILNSRSLALVTGEDLNEYMEQDVYKRQV